MQNLASKSSLTRTEKQRLQKTEDLGRELHGSISELRTEIKDLSESVEAQSAQISALGLAAANHGNELRTEIREQGSEFHSAMEKQSNELRAEIREQGNEFRSAMEKQSNELRAEIREQGNEFRSAMEKQSNELRAEIREQGNEFHSAMEKQSNELRAEIREQGNELRLAIEKQSHEFWMAMEKQSNALRNETKGQGVELRVAIKEQETALQLLAVKLEASNKEVESKFKLVYWQLGIVLVTVALPLTKTAFDYIVGK
ncbi:apolipoprotein A1/A4/E family protein [Pseudomonas sp. MWU13-2100]|uniref:apolipoprotein A1/A4/E family protein n=1 Tax=Pseudomonas sp. MWU13-2100 TaxID=2935075 RepID=UPI00200E58CD|nr:apolipoprotein A1/A4/E family protein [Pseudomonas sp. MWU13-2100]